ncbi:MAG: hypothetical protein IAE79_20010 [Anaerolinea sp.]|nr:hypothetical protein [Anaerolinea sp.]
MTRIFFNDKKFHKILPSSFSEGEFENIITLQAPELYPDYYVIPFKKTVYSPNGNSKPDLVFIAKDYKDWYVVEVEMAYHNFDSHVEPQIENLAMASYDGEDVIKYLCKQCDSLDYTRTSELIRNEPAKLLLVLNELNETTTTWAKVLNNKYGVLTSVFEVFHGSHYDSEVDSPHRAYGISHNYPVYSLSMTTKCSVHPHIAYLGVDDNSNLQLKPGEEIILEFEGCVTFWKGVEGPDKTMWLKMEGRNACINKRKTYQITKLRDNSLFLNMA